MAKTQPADTVFAPGKAHLALVTVVRWTATPGIGTGEQPVLALQIKLAVRYRLPDLSHPAGLPAGMVSTSGAGDRTTPEFVGREAVIYVPCNRNRSPTTRHGREFLQLIGAIPEAKVGDLNHADRWLSIQFGVGDPVYGFQSLVAWKLADAAEVDKVASRVDRKQTPTYCLGLSFPQPGIALRDTDPIPCTIDLTHSRMAWEVLRRLAARYPTPYPSRDLVVDAWTEAGRSVPRAIDDAAKSIIYKLRGLIRPHGLDVVRSHDRMGYRLEVVGTAYPISPKPQR